MRVEAAADFGEAQRDRQRREAHQHEADRAPGADLRRDLRRHQEDRAADHLVDADRGEIPAPERALAASAMRSASCIMALGREALAERTCTPRCRGAFTPIRISIARELERFYFNRWICAGRADQIPNAGDYFTRTLGDESVIVTRDASGDDSRAVQRLPPSRHAAVRADRRALRRAHPVPVPQLDLRPRRPPARGAAHAAGFLARTTTRCIAPAARSGTDTSSCHLGPDGQPDRQDRAGVRPPCATSSRDLPERFAAWRMGDLRLGRRIVYDVKANWKLIVLNYNECLHCPNLHPALNKLHHYLGADNVAPTACYCGGAMGFSDGVETMSMDGKRRRDVSARAERGAAAAGRLLRDLPEPAAQPASRLRDDAHALAARARPHRDRLRVALPPDASSRGPISRSDDAVEFWDLTNREDWWIAEQSQAGINSRVYQPGPYSEREELLWSFDEIVRREAERELGRHKARSSADSIQLSVTADFSRDGLRATLKGYVVTISPPSTAAAACRRPSTNRSAPTRPARPSARRSRRASKTMAAENDRHAAHHRRQGNPHRRHGARR